jgi:hypothetical protein
MVLPSKNISLNEFSRYGGVTFPWGLSQCHLKNIME